MSTEYFPFLKYALAMSVHKRHPFVITTVKASRLITQFLSHTTGLPDLSQLLYTNLTPLNHPCMLGALNSTLKALGTFLCIVLVNIYNDW